MRRIVTGHNQSGKSVIVDDAELPHSDRGPFGIEMTDLWSTEDVPVIPIEESEHKKRPTGGWPQPGGTVLKIWRLHPEDEAFRQAREEGIDLVALWRESTGEEDLGMHTTDTVDYDILLSGELCMQLDDGVEVHLKPGDSVVQNGTRHAWHNRGSEPCVVVSVIVGAERKK